MCPLRGYTVPRAELCGALITSRLMLAVANALCLMNEKPVSAILLLDSRCIISSLEVTSSKFLPFFQNRLAEIQENLDSIRNKCAVEQVHWVPGDLNPADLLTRGTANLRDIGTGSFHLKGPNFLSSPRDSWPVTREFVREEIFDEFRCKANIKFAASKTLSERDVVSETISKLIWYSDSLKKVIRILSRVVRGWVSSFTSNMGDMQISNPKALTLIAQEPTTAEFNRAKKLLLMFSMHDTMKDLQAGKLASLLPVQKGHLIVTCGRLGEMNMNRILGVSSLPILTPKSRVSYLFMLMAHERESGLSNTAVEHYRDAVGTLARSRSYVWVIRGKNLAKQIVKNCVKCRKEQRKLESQQMGMFKEAQMSVSPPWSYVTLDFAGPVLVAGEVQKRIRMKCWILVYVDQMTRAVCLLLTPGYSTSDFLLKHQEFCARKGIPREIISDKGSQLVAASVTIAKKDLPANALDWTKRTESDKHTKWTLVPVGCQWRNQTEAMVKIMKKALYHVLPSGYVLTYSEMVTLLARAAFSVNCRPLGLGDTSTSSQQDEDLLPLTPNQLLLGRTNAEVPDLEYSDCSRFDSRLNYIKAVHSEWWRRWIQDILPTLIPCRRWRTRRRNLQVGDIVMLVYSGNMVDDYRLAKVTRVFPDERKIVRTVEIQYRRNKPKSPWEAAMSSNVLYNATLI